MSAIDTPRGDYDACLSVIAGLVARAESQVGRIERVGVGIPGSIDPADRPGQGRQLDLDDRPAGREGPAGGAGWSPDPRRQRRRHARRVGGARWRRCRLSRGLRRELRQRRGRQAWPSTVVPTTGPTTTLPTGATTRCRGRRRMRSPVRPAGAADAGASRRGSPVAPSRPSTSRPRASGATAPRSWPSRAPATRSPLTCSTATSTAWRVAWPWSSTRSTPISSCSGVGCPTSTSSTSVCRRQILQYTFTTVFTTPIVKVGAR